MAPSTIKVEIKRQSTPAAAATTEKFEIPYRPGMNITSLLGEIALNPVDVSGKATTPVTYDSNCLEEICGSCAMLINGKAAMACSALVDKLTGPNKDQTITLAPLSKFPVVRDLSVDRSVLFENLKKVKAWVPIDGSYDLGARLHRSRSSAIRSPTASLAPSVWRSAPSSTTPPASSAPPPSPRPSSSTWTPAVRSSRKNASAH
jgi:succinate dehydrogenase/fumarate reductase-like Fe-S protein